MKSCLKVSPPYTPLLDSSFGSPSGSGSASPTSGCTQLPTLRKKVSFCHDHLEEYFEADDWDRTPAPVAPKLSYQEILELKEIMKSLPRAPSSSYSRQPFSSTCVPRSVSPPSQSNPPFPISRFASAPSLTPSKWKNRDDSRSTVDPEILPYLDSVPIRLLPLLPPSQESPASGTPRYDSPDTSSTATPAESTQSPCPSAPQSKPINPPTSIALPSTVTPLPSPMPTPQTQSAPPRRKPNFTFLPLLPVQEEPKVAVEPPILTPPTPTRKFNMTFVPLLPPEEVSKPTPPSLPPIDPPSTVGEPEPAETTPQGETPPEEHDDIEHEFSHPSSYVPLNYRRSYAPTPSLCSASDTDTESETPSVSSPCPSSPAESELARPHYFDSRLAAVAHSDGYEVTTQNYNPYFPALPISNSLPSHVIADALTGKKVQLQALPSPALQPPSPFSLNPLDDDAEASTPTKRAQRAFIPRPSSLSSLSAQRQDVLDAVSETLGALAVASTPTLESPAPETPELTIEYMRAAYTPPPNQWSRTQEGILGPSIRRREL